MLPLVNYILAQMEEVEVKIFSKLDTNSGFWQIQIAKISTKLTTFIMHFREYQFNKLPFVITSSPEYFQKMINEDCDGVACLMDDILSIVEVQRNMMLG